jgi:methionine synthase II (cobalamin-independent)
MNTYLDSLQEETDNYRQYSRQIAEVNRKLNAAIDELRAARIALFGPDEPLGSEHDEELRRLDQRSESFGQQQDRERNR